MLLFLLAAGNRPLAALYHKTLKNGEQMFEHLFAVFYFPMLPFQRGREDAYRKLKHQSRKYRTIRTIINVVQTPTAGHRRPRLRHPETFWMLYGRNTLRPSVTLWL
jgi:hypothetical protein